MGGGGTHAHLDELTKVAYCWLSITMNAVISAVTVMFTISLNCVQESEIY